jgi:hypothetical protein
MGDPTRQRWPADAVHADPGKFSKLSFFESIWNFMNTLAEQVAA